MSDPIWQQRADTYWPGTTAMQIPHLPPALYSWANTQNQGWYLQQLAARFEFPYKIYGVQDELVNRAVLAWENLHGNLGILLNGIKGTGKTISAQVIANRFIDLGIPVLTVRSPIPLDDVLRVINQPILVIFDEFEKTYQEPVDQQQLLTTIDGMTRNQHNRMFIFTTNKKTVDENFIDRPSRIRYCWEFGRMSQAVLEELLSDLLLPERQQYRGSIAAYLNSRKVLSMDIAKTVINEVNTFDEAPEQFAPYMNLSEQDIDSMTVNIMGPEGLFFKEFNSSWSPSKSHLATVRAGMIQSGAELFRDTYIGKNYWFNDRYTGGQINFIAPTAIPDQWICQVKVAHRETWLARYPKTASIAYDHMLLVDERPEGWKVPGWVLKTEANQELSEAELDERSNWQNSVSVYGGKKAATMLLQFLPNLDRPQYRVSYTSDAL